MYLEELYITSRCFRRVQQMEGGNDMNLLIHSWNWPTCSPFHTREFSEEAEAIPSNTRRENSIFSIALSASCRCMRVRLWNQTVLRKKTRHADVTASSCLPCQDSLRWQIHIDEQNNLLPERPRNLLALSHRHWHSRTILVALWIEK